MNVPILKTRSIINIQILIIYNQGEYYGATLNFRDQTSYQRDTLHILAKKENGKWRVLSLPPSPVLSAPKYPNVPKEILRKINLDE